MARTVAGQRSFRHELFLYRSAVDLLEFVVPLARGGVAAEEPTLLLLRAATAQAVLQHVGPSPYLTVEPALEQPGRPAQHVATAGSMLPSYARVVHQEPVIPPARWPAWGCLEAVFNIVLRAHDTWAVCAYDRRALTGEMVADLHATHPLIAEDGRHRHNDRYQHPVDFLKHHRNNPPDPVEHTAPAVEVADPSPATARAAVAGFARHHRLPTGEIDNLVFATHEAIANALMHGRPPTLLRLWARPDRVTVTVTDTGPGPSDPLVGLLPPDPLPGPGPGPRLGLWLSHQLVDVAHRHHADGYTIRLAATRPVNRI